MEISNNPYDLKRALLTRSISKIKEDSYGEIFGRVGNYSCTNAVKRINRLKRLQIRLRNFLSDLF